MNDVFIGLGSNLHEPMQQLQRALVAIDHVPETTLIAVSSFYHSQPWGGVEQPAFINAVAEVSTALTPLELLSKLEWIENTQQRVRTATQWGPRTIDLDILLFGILELNSTALTIPHRYLAERAFVVIPLLEIATELVLPNGRKLVDIAASIDQRGLVKIVGDEYDSEESRLSRDF